MIIYNNMNIKSSQSLVNNALQEVKTINHEQAHEMFSKDQCNLIDIRDIRELERDGRIENSHHIPRGMLEFLDGFLTVHTFNKAKLIKVKKWFYFVLVD